MMCVVNEDNENDGRKWGTSNRTSSGLICLWTIGVCTIPLVYICGKFHLTIWPETRPVYSIGKEFFKQNFAFWNQNYLHHMLCKKKNRIQMVAHYSEYSRLTTLVVIWFSEHHTVVGFWHQKHYSQMCCFCIKSYAVLTYVLRIVWLALLKRCSCTRFDDVLLDGCCYC
jgi:hypothetical protein